MLIPNTIIQATSVNEVVAYAEFTANVSITGTVTPDIVVTAPDFHADGVSAYRVEMFAILQIPSNVVGRALTHSLFLDGAALDTVGQAVSVSTTGQSLPCLIIPHDYVLAAGTHSFSWRALTSAGTSTIAAGVGTGGANSPGYIRVTQIA